MEDTWSHSRQRELLAAEKRQMHQQAVAAMKL